VVNILRSETDKEVEKSTMQLLRSSTFLRRVLFADAITCVAAGLLMTLGSGLLTEYLGLPSTLLRYSGISLLPFAALLIYLATREYLSSPVVLTIIVLNALWAADSILLLVTGWVTPTELGKTFVVAQALGVAAFAALDYFGLKRLERETVVSS
jgi:hypothetical protein